MELAEEKIGKAGSSEIVKRGIVNHKNEDGNVPGVEEREEKGEK